MKRYAIAANLNHVTSKAELDVTEAPRGEWVRIADVAALMQTLHRYTLMNRGFDDAYIDTFPGGEYLSLDEVLTALTPTPGVR